MSSIFWSSLCTLLSSEIVLSSFYIFFPPTSADFKVDFFQLSPSLLCTLLDTSKIFAFNKVDDSFFAEICMNELERKNNKFDTSAFISLIICFENDNSRHIILHGKRFRYLLVLSVKEDLILFPLSVLMVYALRRLSLFPPQTSNGICSHPILNTKTVMSERKSFYLLNVIHRSTRVALTGKAWLITSSMVNYVLIGVMVMTYAGVLSQH